MLIQQLISQYPFLKIYQNKYIYQITHVVLRGFKLTSNGPSSWKFPNPVDDAPGPPCE